MSTRALRKLQGGSDIVVPEISDDDSGNEEIKLTASTTKKKKKNKPDAPANPFDILNADDDVDDENNEDKEGDAVEASDAHLPVLDKDTKVSIQEQTKKKKKKKKKKKQHDPDDNKHKEEVTDEVEASVREVNEILGELPVSQPGGDNSHVHMDTRALLTVEHRNLNSENEMRRIFGSRVVQTEQRRRGGRGQRSYQRSTWLAQPRENWPPIGKIGLSMRLIETKNGCQYFTFDHSKEYQRIQFQFLEAVESFNPENIVSVLNLQPYHIDSLLQLSDVCKMSEDMQMAAELLERALLCCEVNFHPLFSLTQGNCRLDYRRNENRGFYLALFRHLHFVGKRGCYRTALEFCKLLLSLDPEGDPLCALLMIDFYALRAEQFTLLIRMYQEWEAHRNLSQLPNFAFSIPLAMFHNANQEGKDTEEADQMLQDSLLMFPGLLIPLLDKCSINPDAEVAAHHFFGTSCQLSQPEGLKQLIALYIGRCHPCWKDPDVVRWLEKNVKEVIKRVDDGDPLAEEYRKKRQGRYRGTPRNIFRHILISEIKDATAALPPHLANTPVMSYDPLPPEDSISSYERPPARQTRAQQESNPLTAFFRSMLPNFNPQEVPDVPDGAVGGAAAPTDMQAGIGALMEAMRDLLNNIRPVDAPREDGQGGDEFDDQDNNPEWD